MYKLLILLNIFFIVTVLVLTAVGVSGKILTQKADSANYLSFWTIHYGGYHVSINDQPCGTLKHRMRGGAATAIIAIIFQFFLLCVCIGQLRAAVLSPINIVYAYAFRLCNSLSLIFGLVAWAIAIAAYHQSSWCGAGTAAKDDGYKIGYGAALLVSAWCIQMVFVTIINMASSSSYVAVAAAAAAASTAVGGGKNDDAASSVGAESYDWNKGNKTPNSSMFDSSSSSSSGSASSSAASSPSEKPQEPAADEEKAVVADTEDATDAPAVGAAAVAEEAVAAPAPAEGEKEETTTAAEEEPTNEDAAATSSGKVAGSWGGKKNNKGETSEGAVSGNWGKKKGAEESVFVAGAPDNEVANAPDN